MDVWNTLLQEVGVDVQPGVTQPLPPVKPIISRGVPIDYTTDNVAIFTTDQVDKWGTPEEQGFRNRYIVTQGMPQYETSFNFSRQREAPRKIHRYSRIERFRFIFNQLCGIGPDVPQKVLEKLRIDHTSYEPYFNAKDRSILRSMSTGNNNESIYGYIEKSFTGTDNNFSQIPRPEIWEYIRNLLKENGLAKYYNRIPAILGVAGYNKGQCKIPYEAYAAIIDDFRRLDYIFPKIKKSINRAYFPSLRYVAYRLMLKHNVTTDWYFTVIRTRHKHAELDLIYSVMWDALWNDDILLNLF